MLKTVDRFLNNHNEYEERQEEHQEPDLKQVLKNIIKSELLLPTDEADLPIFNA